MWWLLFACIAEPDPDLDHDGLPVSRDCDDGDPTIGGVASYWRDVDQDGFGGDIELVACVAPPGASAASGDCADADPVVHPAAIEVCNTLDDDCDGLVDAPDAVGARAWYPDDDRDGWGDAEGRVRACTEPRGHVTDPGDCDDADGRAWPGSSEVCGDGIDQDCDGLDRSCWLGGELSARAADATLSGDSSWSWTGWSIAGAGDVNADGYDDVVIGAYGWSSPPTFGPGQSGGAFVFHGPIVGLHMLLEADASYAGIGIGDAAGMRVAGAGDLDGDGADEVIVDSPYHDHEGAREAGAVFALGQGEGISSLSSAPRVVGASEYAYAGLAVAGVGDWNGDGLADFAYSEWASMGTVRVVPGPIEGVTRGEDAGWLHLAGTSTHQLTGGSLAGVGDLDGDGLPEMAVSARDSSSAGSVWLVSGPLDGAMSLPEAGVLLHRGDSGDEYGMSVGGRMDADGDGYGDLVVGAPGRYTSRGRTGVAMVYLGPSWAADRDPSGVWAGEEAGDRAGEAVAGVGDADGDGLGDLVVGAPDRDETDPGAGVAYVLLDAAEGFHGLHEAELVLLGEGANAALGRSVAAAGDVDGDGLADILVGSPGADGPQGRYSGATYLFLGAPR